MDILYYSNNCKHSQRIIQFLSKGGLLESLNAYCVDKRVRDPKTNQTMIVLETGQHAMLPPNVHSVPALLLTNKNYQIILGDEIIQHFEPAMKKKIANATFGNGEPLAYAIGAMSGSGGSNIMSEQFTYFDMSPHELSAKGMGGQRQMYNYVAADQEMGFIQTPPDTYRPDKISQEVTIDMIQQTRNTDVPMGNQGPQYEYKTMDF
jgi:hypothetical protein